MKEELHIELYSKSRVWLERLLNSKHKDIWLDDNEASLVWRVLNRGFYTSSEQQILNEIAHYYKQRCVKTDFEEYKI